MDGRCCSDLQECTARWRPHCNGKGVEGQINLQPGIYKAAARESSLAALDLWPVSHARS